MDAMVYYAALIEMLVNNTDKEPPKNLTRDVCDGIWYALSTLEQREQECLQLHCGQGASYAELARLREVSADTVRHIEGKAIRKLRDTSRWNYIQFGIAGHLKSAKESSKTHGFNEGYKAGYRDGMEDGRAGKETPATQPEVLNQPIECLELSKRAYNCLIAYGCERIGDVARLPDDTICRMRNLGKKSAKEIACALQNQGVQGSNWEKYIVA